MVGPADIDTTQIKPVDFQDDWSGGMNLVDSANKLRTNEAQIVRNYEIRNRTLVKGKGQRPSSRLEIGALYYDRFSVENLDINLWTVLDIGVGSTLSIVDGVFSFIGQTSGHAWENSGLISTTLSNTDLLSYIEFDITTPTVAADSNTRFRIQLSLSNSVLASDTGLEIEFDENNDVIRREAGIETDTTFDWEAATTYRIRLEKRLTGWIGNIVKIPALSSTEPTVAIAVELFDTIFEGHSDNFLTFQVFGGDWKIDEVVYHEGFIDGFRQSSTGVERFYRESLEPEILVMGNRKVYKYTEGTGYTTLGSGFNAIAKWNASVYLDQMIICNGADDTQYYDGAVLQDLGSGATQAPKAKYTIVHQQTPWLAGDPDFPNTLYRADVGDFTSWDTVDPIVDIDAWNGDIITGLVKIGPSLFIVKSSSVWELIGTSNANYQLRRVLGAAGCVAPYSLATNGQIAFWRGINGIYRFDGVRTVLISFKINPLFEPAERSLYSTTVFEKATESVGVVHNNKYRCSVIQHGEGTLGFNNFEYVYDFVANDGQGGWFQRSNRNVSIYSSWIGDVDKGELYYVDSDASNMLYQAEVEDGNTRHDHSKVTITDIFDTDFKGSVLSRNFTSPLGNRAYLTKQWNPWSVHYEPIGNIYIGARFYTSRNHTGELVVIKQEQIINPQNLSDGIPLGGATVHNLIPGNFEEKIKNSLDASGDKNQSVEIWYEITQGQEVRDHASVNFTGVGRRLGIGNFEPSRIRRISFGFNELNT